MAKMVGGVSQAAVNDFKHAFAFSIGLVFFFLVVFVDWDPFLQGRMFPSRDIDVVPSLDDLQGAEEPNSPPEPVVESPNVRKLIDDIQKAARVASGGIARDLSAAELEKWRSENPCRSRSELLPLYDDRRHVRKLPADPVLDLVLAEYSKLHRSCMLKVGPNVTHFFVNNMTVPGCKFLVGNPMYGTGLGNKMIVAASALLYAVLTQRVLLLPSRTNLPTFMCEPFVGSSWFLDSSNFPMPDGPRGFLPWEKVDFKSPIWTDHAEFLEILDRWFKEEKLKGNGTNHALQHPPSLAYTMSVTERWQPANRFYCSTEQSVMAEVPWLYWGGCIYSVPRIFSSPVFRATLEDLFPDRMVMTRLLRLALLPGDVVFDKLMDLNLQYFGLAERRVGIQLRFKEGKDYYEKMKPLVHQRILDCVVDGGILPGVGTSVQSSTVAVPDPMTKSLTAVFIASLYKGLHDFLSDVYADKTTVTGEDVEVVQVSSNQDQKLSVEEDIQAYVEIMLLSLSDHLLVTPSSTFGSIAQAYGALTPWFMEPRNGSDYKSCQRAQSVEICHQYTEVKYDCPYDSAINDKLVFDEEPSLKRCLQIDHVSGIQLISTFASDD